MLWYGGHRLMDWWLTHGDREPIGPVSTELLLKGIGAGMIPKDAYVCEVGGSTWKPIRKTAPFSIALNDNHARRKDSEEEQTLADAPGDEESLSRFDEVVERTVVDYPRLHSSIPPPMRRLGRFDDSAEKTISDATPLPESEPPDES